MQVVYTYTSSIILEAISTFFYKLLTNPSFSLESGKGGIEYIFEQLFLILFIQFSGKNGATKFHQNQIDSGHIFHVNLLVGLSYQRLS